MDDVVGRTGRAALASIASCLALAGLAMAQPAGTPPPDAKKDAAPAHVIPKPPAPDPNPPPPSSIPKVRVAAKRGQVLPEGAFLVSRRGQVVADSGNPMWGGWGFRFDPDAQGVSEAPMTLMPCSRLDALQQVASQRSGGVEYVVSGQVFMYRGQNYLLPAHAEASAAAPAPEPAPIPEPSTEESDAKPDTPPPAANPNEDDAQRRIRALERSIRTRPRIQLPAAPPAGTPQAAPTIALRTAPQRGSLAAEGTFIASRRGRMVRESDGQWVMRFDAEAAGQVDPPMVVLPCANLERMEGIAAARGDSTTFTVSGEVYTFQNRNYLLPTLFRLDRSNDDLVPGR